VVGQPTDGQEIRRAVERHGVVKAQARTGQHFVGDRAETAVIRVKPMRLEPRGLNPMSLSELITIFHVNKIIPREGSLFEREDSGASYRSLEST
jgi:hypothetical protein